MHRTDFHEMPAIIRSVKLQLHKKLPGMDSQQKMAPSDRTKGIFLSRTGSETVYAGVLILLFINRGKLYTVLIRRNLYPGPHSGQISFPGGKKELSDKTLAETALRETQEETGIPAHKIRVLGPLTPLFIPVSRFMVYPFVGFYPGDPVFNPDPSEVQEIILPDLCLLANGESCKMTIHKDTQTILAPYYEYGNHRIWGATAMILSEFLEILRNTGHC